MDSGPFLGWGRNDDDVHLFAMKTYCERLPELRIDKVQKIYECDTCTRSYANVHNLRRHQLQCGGKEPQIACPYCKNRFYRVDKMRDHVKKIHGWKPKWNPLNKQIAGRDQPQLVQQSHQISNDVKPRLVVRRRRRRRDYVSVAPKYPCRECGAVYTRKDNLLRHQEVRCNKEKTVSCNFCPRMFYDKYGMKKHILNLHKVPKEMLPTILKQDVN